MKNSKDEFTEECEEIYEPMINYLTIHSNIKKFRIRAKLTQAQLAEKSNISSKYLSNLENNHYKSHLHVYIQIADALDISIYDLIEDSKQKRFIDKFAIKIKDFSDIQKALLLDETNIIKKYNFK